MSDPLHSTTGHGHGHGHSPGSTHRELEKPDTRFHDLEANRAITRSRDGDGDLGHQAPPVSNHGFYGHVGNPGLVGLAAHAVTLMLLATSFMRFRGVSAPTAYVGNLFFFAGLYMFTSFNWCLVKGETFAATVFGVFSGFYLSYGAILTPAFNVAASYSGAAGTATDAATEYNSLAIFLLVWNGAFTCIWIASLRTNLALMIVFLGVILGVWCLAGMYIELAKLAQVEATGSMSRAIACSKAGGAWLFISAISGFYLVFVQMNESVGFPFTLPVGDLTRFWPKTKKVD